MFEEDILILNALANGVNYFTGEKSSNDSILNDINIVRTLFNICDKLKNITPDKIKKTNFQFDISILDNFEFENRTISLTEILRKVAQLTPTMKKIKYSQVFDVLNRKGVLVKKQYDDGKSRTIATDFANQYGIVNLQKISPYGKKYTSVGYDINGQRYVLSVLNEIE